MSRITKEVHFTQDVEIEVDLSDFDDDDLIKELLDREQGVWLVEKLDEVADSWEFTRAIRDWAVAEMANHEMLRPADAQTFERVRGELSKGGDHD